MGSHCQTCKTPRHLADQFAQQNLIFNILFCGRHPLAVSDPQDLLKKMEPTAVPFPAIWSMANKCQNMPWPCHVQHMTWPKHAMAKACPAVCSPTFPRLAPAVLLGFWETYREQLATVVKGQPCHGPLETQGNIESMIPHLLPCSPLLVGLVSCAKLALPPLSLSGWNITPPFD